MGEAFAVGSRGQQVAEPVAQRPTCVLDPGQQGCPEKAMEVSGAPHNIA